jgi:hypothetical protein
MKPRLPAFIVEGGWRFLSLQTRPDAFPKVRSANAPCLRGDGVGRAGVDLRGKADASVPQFLMSVRSPQRMKT